MKKFLGFFLMIVGITTLWVASAWADDVMGVSGSDRWQVTLEPYMWAPQMSGSTSFNNVERKVKFDLTDWINTIDEVKLLFMGRAKVQKGRFAIFYDGTFLKLKDNTNGPLVSTEVTLHEAVQELGVSFDAAHWAVGGENKKNLGFEVLGGARYVYLRVKGDVSVPILGLSLGTDRTREWVEPFLGGKLTLGLTEKTDLSLRADFGGGVSSGFLWNGILEVKHYLNKNWFTTIGYRGLNTDYKKGNFKFEVDNFGPVASMGVTF